MCENIYDKTHIELWAKNLLENRFPYIFSNLTKSEKPDLQQGNLWGIEVTRIGYDKDLQITSIWNESAGKNNDQIKQKNRAILEKMNPTYDDCQKLKSFDPPQEWRSGPVDFNSGIQKKLMRLNSLDFNSDFAYNGLFVFDEDHQHQHSIQEIITQFNGIQVAFEKKFDFLFVWDSFHLHMYSNITPSSEDLCSIKNKTIEECKNEQ